MERKKYQYWLANLFYLHKATRNAFYQLGIGAEEIYHLTQQELEAIKQINPEDIEKMLASKKSWNLDMEYERFLEKGIGFVCVEDEEYPEKLREISDMPYQLFYVGNLPARNHKSIAIVGARGRTAYGNEVAQKLAYLLGKNGIDVISGLAIGIDTDAHRGCLEGGGNTYAVLGCGVDICYPRQNQFLYDQILKSGGIISENPLGTKPMAYLFPPRNRIISAFADAVVVVEAKKKSGSLITADFAMEQGKDVYAVPGRISEPLSQGCNQLIYQGAGMLNDLEAFVKDLVQIEQVQGIQMSFCKNLLEKEELLVYSLLDFCPKGLGNLVECSGLQLDVLLKTLEGLTHKGFARETVPNYYTRTL